MNLNIFMITLTILMNTLGCYAENEKRILMSDPQYSHGIEATLQALTSRIDHLESQHQTDTSRIETQRLADISRLETQLHKNISQLKTQHQADILRLETQHQSDITQIKGSLAQCQADNQALKSDKGGLYVRWGRTTCPAINDTEMVYTGYTGGSLYYAHGAATNHLCMPKDPEFLADQSSKAHVYGTEYEQNLNGNNYNNDAPCSVCKAQRTSILMLPGRQHCYPDWVMEYTGILVAGASGYAGATEYICLDSAPESLDHGAGDDNGNLLLSVSSQCGSLPCPPYKDNGILSCVVCSK